MSFNFEFCIQNSTRERIKKHCIKSDDGYYLKINDDETIGINFFKIDDHEYIRLDLSDAIKFIIFVNERKLYCDIKPNKYYVHTIIDHDCKHDNYSDKYLKYITENNLIEHINSLVEAGTKRYYYWHQFHPTTIFYYICQYSSLDCAKNFVTNFKWGDSHYYLSACKRNSYEMINYLLEEHEKYLKTYFTENSNNNFINNEPIDYIGIRIPVLENSNNSKIRYRDQKCCEMDYHNVLLFLLYQRNVSFFKHLIDSINVTIERMKEWSIEKSLMQEFDRCVKSLSLTQWKKERLLYKCIQKDIPEIAKFLLPNDNNIKCSVSNSFPIFDLKQITNTLLKNNKPGMLKLFLEKGIYNKQEINDMLNKSHKYNYEIIKILIDYSADYNIYVDKILKKAEKHKNQQVVDFLKNIITQEK